MHRRTVLRGAATLLGSAAVPSVARGETKVDPDPDLRIDIYVAEAASGSAQAVNHLAARMQQVFEAACPNLSVRVGPVGFVDVPERTRQSPEAAWRWWRGHDHDSDVDSNLLLLPYEWFDDPGGYAGIGVNKSSAISCGVEYVDGGRMGNLAIHEVGHNLGLRHSQAEKGTLMNHIVPTDTDATFSERACRALRANT